jgi:dipeptidyl aminopeptidase/acylaminoacyl peptidase
MKKLVVFFCLLISAASAQLLAPLTVEKIMRDQKWMGVSPSGFHWSADSKTLYFNWNPERKERRALYQVSVFTGKIKKSEKLVAEKVAPVGNYMNLGRDTISRARILAKIPGIKDLPDYLKDYPLQLKRRKMENLDRKVELTRPYWNDKGTMAIYVVKAKDNKDLWLMKLDAATGEISVVDRQHDDAWVGGPGLGVVEWLDGDRIFYTSEASGYAHIYVANVKTGTRKQLTSGKWEVQSLQLSKNKKWFYFTANKAHPGVTHFYRIGVSGGDMTQITHMKGGNEVLLSPDERWLAINYSYMNKPWELYLQRNQPGAKAMRITSSTTAEFNSYKWLVPDLLSFKNRYGDDIYARVYPAKRPHSNRPAVVFVHGAGYLQDAHYWWSRYSREYMFNNLLADNGYTVIEIDYTASAGYGRNHRTGIYRYMGGKDLTDQVDGLKMLVNKYHVNPKHIGIYGGSYGGFITLMALFKEAEVFRSGAALRAVADWSHYDQDYTFSILNEPYNDELAYKRSSPIYFAEGLKGDLLMCHGVLDDNVGFLDIERLSRRLKALGKSNWELVAYQQEGHVFTEPVSWTDEYTRIYKLFEQTLKNP